ncbi:SpoIIE family protein phosphatase [Nostoc sp. CHAB 5836]|uniref:DAHL domain-containing protein n=1 Tax=Nostoc sp. CHAB 5836 TaxID=2780404 RepID=UPI001E497437|nr:DAHL domain-containing protein [Nostoc sp. CHAB 5836]MCC5618430.1 SpoIIE family protein phosphatase [Nostoc sp. CHAB 5836]
MKHVQLQTVFIALAAILILAFLISKSLSIDFNQHQIYRSAIVQLQEKDATFNQDILKFRYELFNSYDSLVNSLTAQKKIQQQMQKFPSFIDKKEQRQIQNLLAEQAELVQKKEKLSERFKSQNATLKNSLRYLPTLIAEIKEPASDQKWFVPLKTTLNNLLYDILLYNLTASEDLKPLIKAQIRKLSQIKDQYKVSEKQFSINLTISHTIIILNNKPQVDELTNQILNIPIAQQAKTLETAYDDSYQKAIQTVNIYRLFAYGWSLVLLAGISYLIINKFSEANHKITVLNERLKAENLRMGAELEITSQLQQMLLPKDHELSQIPGLEIAGFMEPADQVGGDYYDVLANNEAAKIGIGDVTGHGLESVVLMLMVQTAIRTLQESNETDPVRFMDVLNRTIYKNVERMNTDKNLTLALLDYHQGKLNISGQHEEMVVVRASGEVERVETMDLGFPIGLDSEIADFIAQEQVQLHSGDVVVLYTDGITEAEDINGVQYGIERLCKVVKYYRQRSATEINEAVIRNLRQYIGAQKVFDDITLLVLKQK